MPNGLDRLEPLLQAALARGPELLRELAAAGVRRLLRAHPAPFFRSPHLFTPEEQAELASLLASVNAAADLLGRKGVRDRLTQEVARFNEDSEPDWAEWFGRSLRPRAALDWFQGLFPTRVHPELFDLTHRGEAFQLAVTTDQTILRKVHEVIADRLETGKEINSAPRVIDEILDGAGITHRAGYSEMVFRTNAMEAMRKGFWAEAKDPDVQPFFACWQWLGIADGRERMGPLPRADHHRFFGKYFPMGVDFFTVRGNRAEDVIQCRCDSRLVTKREWSRLEAQGARIETAW